MLLTPEVNLGNVTGMGDITNTIHLWGGTRWGPRRQTVMRIHSRGRSNSHYETVEEAIRDELKHDIVGEDTGNQQINLVQVIAARVSSMQNEVYFQ